MAKTAGIIAEYNPFHKGHRFQIEYLKSKGYSSIAVAMSGSCVQRGEFSLLSKFERAKMAVNCGVNLVCEIPYPYSSMSAEGFARSGVHILKNLGVDAICFGSESDDINLLTGIARYLLSEEYETSLKKHLAGNTPFATAREKAILEKFDVNRETVAASNDILALEYIRECIKTGWDVEFVPVKRKGANYNDLTAVNGFASASGIRNAVGEYRFEYACEFVPDSIKHNFLSRLEQGDYFIRDNAFERYAIATMKKLKAADFAKLADCNEELSNAFETAAAYATGFENLFEKLPTKQYTRARLNRIILASLLGNCTSAPLYPPFIRILAMDAEGENIIRKAHGNSALPISHSYRILQDTSENCKAITDIECLATDLQELFFRFPGESRKDFTTKLYKK